MVTRQEAQSLSKDIGIGSRTHDELFADVITVRTSSSVAKVNVLSSVNLKSMVGITGGKTFELSMFSSILS